MRTDRSRRRRDLSLWTCGMRFSLHSASHMPVVFPKLGSSSQTGPCSAHPHSQCRTTRHACFQLSQRFLHGSRILMECQAILMETFALIRKWLGSALPVFHGPCATPLLQPLIDFARMGEHVSKVVAMNRESVQFLPTLQRADAASDVRWDFPPRVEDCACDNAAPSEVLGRLGDAQDWAAAKDLVKRTCGVVGLLF